MSKKKDTAKPHHKTSTPPAPAAPPTELPSEPVQAATGEVPVPSAEVHTVKEPAELAATPSTTVIDYENHELADIFPLMQEKELKALADDIKTNGQHQQAVIHKGKILDGRNRAAACKIAGVPLTTTPLPAGTDPVVYVIAANLRRRQLTPTQLAIVAAKLLPHYTEEAAKRKQSLSGTRANADGSEPEVTEHFPEPEECGEAREKAAQATGANPRYVSDAFKLQSEAPDLFKAVESGEMKIPAAMKVLASRSEPEADNSEGKQQGDHGDSSPAKTENPGDVPDTEESAEKPQSYALEKAWKRIEKLLRTEVKKCPGQQRGDLADYLRKFADDIG